MTFTPEPGKFYDGIPNEAYHAGPGRSSTQLKLIQDWCPSYFQESMGMPNEQTAAMARGSAVHAMVLEPENVDRDFIFVPGTKKGTKKYNEAAETGRSVVCQDRAELQTLADAVLAHRSWRTLVGPNPICERSFYWTDEATGLFLKARTDALRLNWNGERALITDLKTAEDPRLPAFGRAIGNFGYDFSAAMYCAGVEAVLGVPCDYLWLVVRSKWPHVVAVHDAVHWLRRGKRAFRRTLTTLAECEKSGVWPGLYGDKPVQPDVPRYLQIQGDNDDN